MIEGRGKRYFTDPFCRAGRRYYKHWPIRNGKTGTAIGHKENRSHCDSIEVSVIRIDKQDPRDRRVSFVLITQMIMPTRLKNVTARTARTIFFLPENAYVRHIRMTEDECE